MMVFVALTSATNLYDNGTICVQLGFFLCHLYITGAHYKWRKHKNYLDSFWRSFVQMTIGAVPQNSNKVTMILIKQESTTRKFYDGLKRGN